MVHRQPRSGDALADNRAGYAHDLAADGDVAAAADLMRQALERAPRWTGGWMTLGAYLESAARPGEAAEAYRNALGIDAEDGHGAALKLAALGHAPTPRSAPPAFVRDLFDQYADSFEASLVGKLGYGVPDQLMSALQAVLGGTAAFRHALDLGCGTGLMGERLRKVTGVLSGIDLSPAMIAKAHKKGRYDHLLVGDILDASYAHHDIDLVTAADVLIYVGDLGPVFDRVSRMLAPGGLFALSLEAHDGDEAYVVGPSLRYAHSRNGALDHAAQAGLVLRSEARLVLRQDRGAPVEGFAFVFEKPGPAD